MIPLTGYINTLTCLLLVHVHEIRPTWSHEHISKLQSVFMLAHSRHSHQKIIKTKRILHVSNQAGVIFTINIFSPLFIYVHLRLLFGVVVVVVVVVFVADLLLRHGEHESWTSDDWFTPSSPAAALHWEAFVRYLGFELSRWLKPLCA